MSTSWLVSRGTPSSGASKHSLSRRRGRWLAIVAAIALPAAVVAAPVALAGSVPPFTIDGTVPGADGAQSLTDPDGNVKELGPLNSSTTKISVIHNSPLPTLGLTNPNAQVDLNHAWLGAAKDSDNDDWLYFAWQRDSNTGSGFIAYEFMQDPPPAACDYANSTQQQLINTCNPWKNRKAGDFLILWDQQGGSKNLYLRTWSGTAPNLVLSAPQLLNANVSAAAYSSDGFQGEAALNLTDAVFGGVQSCRSFANVIPSTVTGNSDSADYKDTILQPVIPVGGCTSTTVTTPKQADGTTNIPAGGLSITTAGVREVKDSALISIAGGSATPAGTVQFSLCKASNAANATCDSAATPIGSPVNVTGAAFPVTVTSPSAWVTAAARYCWKASYSGISSAGIGGSSDVSTGECFVVNPVQPTLTTTAGNDVLLGSAVTDDASLTGTAPKPTNAVIHTTAPDPATRTAATGTITFTLVGPGDCTTVAATRTATVSGDNTYSVSATPTAAGDYHWKASYDGDSPNTTNASHNAGCTETGEDVTVNPVPTTTVTTPRVGSTPITTSVPVGTSVTDHAVVTGTAAGGSPTGTVDFFVCNPTQVAANGGTCATGGTAAGTDKGMTAGAGNTATSDSDAVTASTVGVWCFRAVYKPGSNHNYLGSSDASTGECFTVRDSTSASSVQNWLPNDSATIGSAGGTALKGTLSFTLYDSADCTGTVLRDPESFPIDQASPATRSTTNSDVLVSTSKTVSWKVVFASDNPLVDGSNHCEKTQLIITN
ncbi:hemagglutinin [Intrasporangium mesophilum]